MKHAQPAETDAEYLDALARDLLYPKGRLIMVTPPTCPCCGDPVEESELPSWGEAIATSRLAILFHRRGPAFVLHAIVEDWDRSRIIQEMF